MWNIITHTRSQTNTLSQTAEENEIQLFLRHWGFSNTTKCNSRGRIMQLPKSHPTIKNSARRVLSCFLPAFHCCLTAGESTVLQALIKIEVTEGKRKWGRKRAWGREKERCTEREHCQGHNAPSLWFLSLLWLQLIMVHLSKYKSDHSEIVVLIFPDVIPFVAL